MVRMVIHNRSIKLFESVVFANLNWKTKFPSACRFENDDTMDIPPFVIDKEEKKCDPSSNGNLIASKRHGKRL